MLEVLLAGGHQHRVVGVGDQQRAARFAKTLDDGRVQGPARVPGRRDHLVQQGALSVHRQPGVGRTCTVAVHRPPVLHRDDAQLPDAVIPCRQHLAVTCDPALPGVTEVGANGLAATAAQVRVEVRGEVKDPLGETKPRHPPPAQRQMIHDDRAGADGGHRNVHPRKGEQVGDQRRERQQSLRRRVGSAAPSPEPQSVSAPAGASVPGAPVPGLGGRVRHGRSPLRGEVHQPPVVEGSPNQYPRARTVLMGRGYPSRSSLRRR